MGTSERFGDLEIRIAAAINHGDHKLAAELRDRWKSLWLKKRLRISKRAVKSSAVTVASSRRSVPTGAGQSDV
jgi:hypothetical protein